ncbi:MAG: DUF5305 domain-containing protein [Haloarculaceae archaeon]
MGALAGGAGYVHARGGARTVTERTHVQTVRLGVNDSARVTDGDSLWAAGTRLRDRPVYLQAATPNLTVLAHTSVPRSTAVDLRQRIVLVIHASADGEPLWSDTRTLASRETTVTDGRGTVRTTLSVPALRDRLDRVRASVAAPVTLSVDLRVRSRYDTGRYAGTLSTAAPLSLRSGTYSVGAFDPATRTHERRVTRRVDRSGPGPRRSTLAGGAVALLSLVGAVAAVAGYRRFDDGAAIRRRLERTAFEEWISAGRLPADPEGTTVTVASLADLVDVAIDSDGRVIHDAERGRYAVLDGGAVYVYDPDGPAS